MLSIPYLLLAVTLSKSALLGCIFFSITRGNKRKRNVKIDKSLIQTFSSILYNISFEITLRSHELKETTKDIQIPSTPPLMLPSHLHKIIIFGQQVSWIINLIENIVYLLAWRKNQLHIEELYRYIVIQLF